MASEPDPKAQVFIQLIDDDLKKSRFGPTNRSLRMALPNFVPAIACLKAKNLGRVERRTFDANTRFDVMHPRAPLRVRRISALITVFKGEARAFYSRLSRLACGAALASYLPASAAVTSMR